MKLDPAAVRVLGVLIEKEMATPDYYPLSLNALINACNQKTNRDPVTSLGESEVAAALGELEALGLARRVTGEGRVVKYAHRVYEALDLGNRETAVLGVLLLRGPQTAGELRSRTQSLYAFADLEAVEACLGRLADRSEPLVTKLAMRPGTKEPRYAQLLGEVGEVVEVAESPDRVARLEAAVEALTREVAELRGQLAEFRRQFE
jgi:uncharacterized protein